MATRRIVSDILAALFLLAAPTNAQEIPLRSDLASSCRFDSTSIRDTIDFTLFLTPPRSVAKARARREQYAPYINAIASTFTQPPRLSISYWPGEWADKQIGSSSSVGDCDAWCTAGPLEGEVQFRFNKGRPIAVSWWLVPDSPEVMRALEHAIRQADSLSLFPSRHKLAGLPQGTVRLAMRLARWPPVVGGVPLGHVRLPHVRITRPVGIIFQPTPHFPNAAAEYGLSGVISLQYIVGENGRVAEESIRVLDAEEPALIQSAVRAIAGSQFRPAEAGGCPVRQLVQQRVAFRQR
jgi:hypothetical protein